MTPDEEYTLARSAAGVPPSAGRVWTAERLLVSGTGPLRTLRGRDSRLPPKIDDGASALTDAFVSRELRLRRFEDEARVTIDALSVKRLFAVAKLYEGWPPTECPPTTCEGIADTGDVGN